MPTKISDLTAAASLDAADVVPVVDVSSSTTKKATVTVLRDAILPADLASADVTGVLPAANQEAQALGGDVGGTTAASTISALAVSKLAPGTNTHVLTTTGGVAVWQAPPAAFSAPTGTGFVSVTAGVLDGASIKVNLASSTYVTGVLPEANGGTGVSALGTGVATWLATPSSANLIALLSDETGTGACVFGTSPTFRTSVLINNPANTFAYTLTPAAIAANRILNLPLLTATDTVAVLALAQTFTNKSMVLASNTITDTSQALGDIAYCNGTRFVRFARGATAGQSLTATATTIAYSSNPGVAAQAIAALAIDWSAGTVFTKTLAAGGNTFTFSNAASGMTIMVRLTGAASTVTWPTVRWAGGVAPTQTASGTDVYTFVHDGTNIYGSVVQAMA